MHPEKHLVFGDACSLGSSVGVQSHKLGKLWPATQSPCNGEVLGFEHGVAFDALCLGQAVMPSLETTAWADCLGIAGQSSTCGAWIMAYLFTMEGAKPVTFASHEGFPALCMARVGFAS